MTNKRGTDILTLIADQHKLLDEEIKTLISLKAADEKKQKALCRFIPTLKMHSEAEEQTIYALMSEKAAREQDAQIVIEAQTEHKLAKSLVNDLEREEYQTNWDSEIAAKAKVLAEIVEHHAKEEEAEFFKAIRKTLNKSERLEVGVRFQEKCDEVAEKGAENPNQAKSKVATKKGKHGKQTSATAPAR